MTAAGGGPDRRVPGRRAQGRLPPSSTQRIDRTRPLAFEFLGRPMTGFAGDTVASALYGCGVRTFGRSLKYHRPRGLYSMDGESSTTFMTIDGVPNECAETTQLAAGMSVGAQNVRGDPETDRLGFIDRFDRFMPAGFYYRVFHRPYRLWPFFRDRLRRLAGLGVLDPRGRYRENMRAERYLNADLAVVGGGAAGMRAALAAAGHGLRVCLFERRPWLGGHLAWRVRDFEGVPLHRRASGLAERLRTHENVRVFTGAPVTGIWGENLLTGFMDGGPGDGFAECHWECRARTVVVASGSMERPLVFNHNDRPGVIQAATAWRLARIYGVKPGAAAVFSVGDDLSVEAALDLADLGVEVRAVADARGEHHDAALAGRLEERGIPFLPGWAAARTFGSVFGRALGRVSRGGRVSGCELRALQGADGRRVACDLLVANAGLQPRIGPLATAKAELAYCTHTHGFRPVRMPVGIFVAGSVTGLRDPGSIEASGRLAGLRAARRCGRVPDGAVAAAEREAAARPGPAAGCAVSHGPAIGRGRKAFVDLDEDGTYKNVKESAAQGFDVPELAKRFGGFGLGPGQHRVAGQNLAMIMAEMAGDPVETAAPTTVRPPLVPPSLATLAGPGRDVHKRTPLHREQAARGAVFRRAGSWERARYFGGDPTCRHEDHSCRGEDHSRGKDHSRDEDRSCRDEIRSVRDNVGILDSSPLGKFRIFGPDALNALQRVYISDMRKAGVGRCKYSAMCNDTGNVMDDGVVVGEGGGAYYFTTSSGRAASTVEWFRYHTRYDGWDYHLVNLTDVLGSLNLAGPNARRVLERVTDDDVSNEAFPYMACRRIIVGDGVEARCLRLGFVGELSYELHVPSSWCRYLWDLLMEAGADFRVRPFGLEAQYCLRAEKGHVIVGAESEQRVTLTDIGMGWMWDREDTASKKVGAPALRACAKQPGRMKLVGLRVDEGAEGGGGGPRDGALVVDGDEIVGYVCTTRRSETLGWQYGMALVRDGHAAKGGRIHLHEEKAPGKSATYSATVVSPPFYDPKGTRLRA